MCTYIYMTHGLVCEGVAYIFANMFVYIYTHTHKLYMFVYIYKLAYICVYCASFSMCSSGINCHQIRYIYI